MKRREFLSAAVVPYALAVSPALARGAPQVRSRSQGRARHRCRNRINQQMDVAVQGGKIARVDSHIAAAEAKTTVDVSGYYVTPGLIDLHICCYYTNLSVTASVIADHHCLPSGVTTCCDGGTAGAETFEDFKKIIDRSRMRILSFLNIAAPGAQACRSRAGSLAVQGTARRRHREKKPRLSSSGSKPAITAGLSTISARPGPRSTAAWRPAV